MAMSAETPLFEKSAEEIVARLVGDDSLIAKKIRDEAIELLKKFQAWTTAPPDGDDRVQTIKRLFDLYREALDHASRKP